MRNPVVDHIFSKMIEGRHERALAAESAQNVLGRIEEIAETIRKDSGEEATQSILSYREVKHALERIADYCTDLDSSVTNEDHTIYYSFASDRLKEAQKFIDKELGHLDL
jgi:phosphate uptake regulator